MLENISNDVETNREPVLSGGNFQNLRHLLGDLSLSADCLPYFISLFSYCPWQLKFLLLLDDFLLRLTTKKGEQLQGRNK